ncbi:MAG: TonB-dependent receptor plug domain-containing protein [Bacteroidia bacterium]|nr:TonB-dependent receptor [Bacteroidia bacterium]MDW8333223.1 TonB-dependent receptor plug domain-containing protein [Bacteroidia bacterium]
MIFGVFEARAQTVVTGRVVDEFNSQEPLVGVTVRHGDAGTFTDPDGYFFLRSAGGRFVFTYAGYDSLVREVRVPTGADTLDLGTFSLKTIALKDVQIVADVAQVRETPVAFSTVSLMQIREELAGRDLPLVLNTTPGAYATESGGGYGDSRINIRGFDSRVVGTLVDGVPVNDMENGRVYWSNWAGLGQVTQSLQVQRGLGASKLAINAVGGTINIITKGITAKREIFFRQEYASNSLFTTILGYNSGQLKGGWGVTVLGSRVMGKMWVRESFVDGWAYFVKVQKLLGSHMLTFCANGAPQRHGQRPDKLFVTYYSHEYARKIGVTDAGLFRIVERGRNYNQNWGYLQREGEKRRVLNEGINFYHKPQISLSHNWNPNARVYWSSVAYLSIGMGGGTGLSPSFTIASDTTGDGQVAFQRFYDNNRNNPYGIDPLFSSSERKSSKFLQAARNEHVWYGILSTFRYQLTQRVAVTTGFDGRSFRSNRYRTPYDLLGADYVADFANANAPRYEMKRVGDKIGYHVSGRIHWAGLFLQGEYKGQNFTAFAALTGSISAYRQINYFRKKDLVLSDTTMRSVVGYGDTVVRDGKIYTINSPEARPNATDFKIYPGFTFKTGANYNIDERFNVFANVGHYTMAPRFNNVFRFDNSLFPFIKNQKIYSAEAGAGYRNKHGSLNVNVYYTYWQNRPPDAVVRGPDPDLNYNMVIDAAHAGFELDGKFRVLKWLQLEGLFSWGDWRYVSEGWAYGENRMTGAVEDSFRYAAKGVPVGDAAQTQIGFSPRFEPLKRLYIKPRWTFFGRHWADFDPYILQEFRYSDGRVVDNRNRRSWRIPDYHLVELHAGYAFTAWKLRFNVSASVVNLLDAYYITDAQNGSSFDANTAVVFMGQGVRFNAALTVTY